MKQKEFPYIGLVCLAVVLTFLLSLPMPAISAQKEYKVGCALAFSGPLAFVGNGFRNGSQIAADYFNNKGGLKIGKDMYVIKLIDADNKYTSDGGTTAARRLVDADKVNMVVGGISTPDTLGVLSVTEPAKILTLHTAAADETLSKKYGRHYAFRSYISYNEAFPGALKYLANVRKVKRLALLDIDDESGHFGHELMKKLSTKVGIEVVYNDYFPAGVKDMGPFILNAMGNKPDAFFNCASSGAYWGLLIKQARDLGFKGLFAESHPPTPKQTGEIAGMPNVQGMVGFGYASEGKLAPEGVMKFRSDYTKKFGEWHEHSLVPGLPLSAIFMAIEEAGTLDVEKIVTVLESGKHWKTPFGITGTFGGTSRYGHPHQWFAPQYAIEIQGDKAVPIAVIPMEDMLHGWD
jgi:branched-chain amino acid transport system substrate-binding protein